MMEMIMKSLVLLSSLVLGACASTSGAPLQNCDALLQSFIPVQCQEVTGGLLCVNENQKYLSVLSGEKNIKFHHTKAKEAGYVKKPVSTQCSVQGVGVFEASYWERDKLASAPRLDYKTL
jgi:hypothetical protein